MKKKVIKPLDKAATSLNISKEDAKDILHEAMVIVEYSDDWKDENSKR